MNRQAICHGHYCETGSDRTSQRPLRLVLRDLVARMILGDLRGGAA